MNRKLDFAKMTVEQLVRHVLIIWISFWFNLISKEEIDVSESFALKPMHDALIKLYLRKQQDITWNPLRQHSK